MLHMSPCYDSQLSSSGMSVFGLSTFVLSETRSYSSENSKNECLKMCYHIFVGTKVSLACLQLNFLPLCLLPPSSLFI